MTGLSAARAAVVDEPVDIDTVPARVAPASDTGQAGGDVSLGQVAGGGEVVAALPGPAGAAADSIAAATAEAVANGVVAATSGAGAADPGDASAALAVTPPLLDAAGPTDEELRGLGALPLDGEVPAADGSSLGDRLAEAEQRMNELNGAADEAWERYQRLEGDDPYGDYLAAKDKADAATQEWLDRSFEKRDADGQQQAIDSNRDTDPDLNGSVGDVSFEPADGGNEGFSSDSFGDTEPGGYESGSGSGGIGEREFDMEAY